MDRTTNKSNEINPIAKKIINGFKLNPFIIVISVIALALPMIPLGFLFIFT
ncbi:MAG: hypothetical protein ACRC3Y_02330 [Romboutsia sp.]|uniref:hypothetical protein n=1 Tax=Romboutsia sp. TaxID=1965302 RepID=UPI003F2AF54D